MSKKIVSLDVPSVGMSDDAYAYFLRSEFIILKARLMNLAESITPNEKQNEAIKGLMKDFVNQAYYKSLDSIEMYLEAKVGSSKTTYTPRPDLDINSLKDVQL